MDATSKKQYSPCLSLSAQVGQSKTQSEAEAFKTFHFFEQIQ
jgi:hypothetical protein